VSDTFTGATALLILHRRGSWEHAGKGS